jgi:hypothetical protein
MRTRVKLRRRGGPPHHAYLLVWILMHKKGFISIRRTRRMASWCTGGPPGPVNHVAASDASTAVIACFGWVKLHDTHPKPFFRIYLAFLGAKCISLEFESAQAKNMAISPIFLGHERILLAGLHAVEDELRRRRFRAYFGPGDRRRSFPGHIRTWVDRQRARNRLPLRDTLAHLCRSLHRQRQGLDTFRRSLR